MPPTEAWNGYSPAERDRRWDAVRNNAQASGLDCVFVPIGNAADARYLTEFRVASIVLPSDGRPPIVVTDRGAGNHWLSETRQANRQWAEPMAQALLDAGMERARIGVAGLQAGAVTHVRAPHGVVNHSAYAHVMRRLPNATFTDATDVVGMARYVKSAEEVGCLRKATAIAEEGVAAMVESARPGEDAAAMYASVMDRMLRLGSEYYPLALYVDPIDQPPTERYTNPPLDRPLRANDLITNEVSAVWGGLVAQEDQPIVLGPVPDKWRPVIELQREVFQAGLERMRPGTPFGELIDFTNDYGDARGMKTSILMHGRGLGDDGPLLTPRTSGGEVRDLAIQDGNVWVWKPTAHSTDGRLSFTWGGDVVVGEQGGVPLFQRPHGMVSTG